MSTPKEEPTICIPLRGYIALQRLVGFAQSIPSSEQFSRAGEWGCFVPPKWRDTLLRLAKEADAIDAARKEAQP